MILFNLMLFVALRDRVYLLYAGAMLFHLLCRREQVVAVEVDTGGTRRENQVVDLGLEQKVGLGGHIG